MLDISIQVLGAWIQLLANLAHLEDIAIKTVYRLHQEIAKRDIIVLEEIHQHAQAHIHVLQVKNVQFKVFLLQIAQQAHTNFQWNKDHAFHAQKDIFAYREVPPLKDKIVQQGIIVHKEALQALKLPVLQEHTIQLQMPIKLIIACLALLDIIVLEQGGLVLIP